MRRRWGGAILPFSYCLPRYRSMAEAAAIGWIPYLSTPVPGLWRDLRLAGGEIVASPAPASTFYHLVGAIAALDRACS